MRNFQEVVWVKPKPVKTRKKPVLMGFAPVKESLTSGLADNLADVINENFLLTFNEAIQKIGVPNIPGSTPDQELLEHLLSAAEIEHGLMAIYLYAGNCCTHPETAGNIVRIAVEEMGHLITVQNLLLAIGHTPYLGRYDESPQNYDPFAFKLEPVTRLTIAKYAACEMPEEKDIDPDDLEVLQSLLVDAATSAGNMAPHRIGLLYAKIYWLLRENDDDLPNPADEPWEGFPVNVFRQTFPGRHASFASNIPLTIQAKKSPWQRGIPGVIVRTISNRADALKAVAEISAQGEGFGSHAESHFDRFVDAYRVAAGGGPINLDVPVDPWYRVNGVPGGDPASEIKNPTAMDFARLSDLVYEIVILAITLAVHPDSGYTEAKRRKIGTFCLDLMMDSLRPLIIAMHQIGIRDEAGSPKLMPCFGMPPLPDAAALILTQLNTAMTDTIVLATNLSATATNPDLADAALTIKDYIENEQSVFQP